MEDVGDMEDVKDVTVKKKSKEECDKNIMLS